MTPTQIFALQEEVRRLREALREITGNLSHRFAEKLDEKNYQRLTITECGAQAIAKKALSSPSNRSKDTNVGSGSISNLSAQVYAKLAFFAIMSYMKGGCLAMPFEREIETYNQNKDKFLSEGLEGQFVLIKDDKVIRMFPTLEQAYEFGLKEYGNVPMYIKKIQKEDPPNSSPALMFGLLHAGFQ